VTSGQQLATGIVLGLAAVLLAGFAVAWHPTIAPVEPPAQASFDGAEVKRGEGLALIGECMSCHTADSTRSENGKPLAGGRPMTTPFGTVFTTNITPDRETGIGTWSREAFARAMRSGVAQNGQHLYPAFPYDHFTKANDPDLAAIYAWLMTRQPVSARAPANELKQPFGWRPFVALWNLRYLREGPPADDPRQSAEWNRGRALVEGPAHCGACHTPRDRFGGEDKARAYDGAMVEGWYAPPLNTRSPAVRAWTADRLFAYLRTGLSPSHSAVAGPMGAVTRALARAPEQDVRAIAVYVASLMANAPAAKDDLPTPDNQQVADQARPEAALLFAGACSGCHGAGAPMTQQGRPPLSWGTALHEDSPHNTVRIIMRGLAPPVGPSGPAMPAFADYFTDHQLADLAAYLRARYTDKPPWPDIAEAISAARLERTPPSRPAKEASR
jgi:mono/diheme cytochrome c family protein